MNLQIISLVLFGTLLAFGSPLSSPGTLQYPLVVETKAPIYPAIARMVLASGTVIIEVEIDPAGRVASAKAISGHPLFYDASRNAALGWRFEASRTNDSNRIVRLTFDYSLETTGCDQAFTITPYHLRVSPGPPPDTVSYIPDNAEGMHCKVHGTQLLRDKVKISYGLIGYRKGYLSAEKKLFPEANSEYFAGCVVETTTCDGKQVQLSPKFAEVLYCPVCRRAQAKWSKQHSHDPFQP